MSTPLNRLCMPMVYSSNNRENPKVLHPLFSYRSFTTIWFIAPIVLPIDVDSTLTTVLNADIQRPQIDDDGKYSYRRHVTARLSLTGPVLRRYSGVVLAGTVLPNMDQLVLWCYAECGSCVLSRHPQCNPISFYLDPEYDRKHNWGFKLDWSNDTFTGVVTFNIEHRPRKPKLGDPTRRCASEALQ